MSVTINGTSGVTFNDASNQTTAATGFGFKNRIINGAMVIDQRNAGASVTPTDQQVTLDRWKFRLGAASKISTQQSSTAPVGFVNSLLVTSLSAYSSGASEQFYINQRIEGYNIADLGWGTANASTVTLSFWVRSSLTGTFGGAVFNVDANRSYPFTFTISSANTFEYKTVTIAGDTTGTWNTGNSIGISLAINLGSGSSLQATAGTWASGFYPNATGATSVVGTNGATFYITGVQLEKGSTATNFDYRPYGTELALCQRYYQRYGDATSGKFVGSLGVAPSSGEYDMCFPLTVAMRSAPTMNYANMQITDGAGNNFTPSSITTYQATTTTAGFYMNTTGMTAFRPYFLRTSSSAGYLDASSEL